MFRFIAYFLLFYVLWRVVNVVIHGFVGPTAKPRATAPRSDGRDFSHVQEAEFEDITPPREKNDTSSTSPS